MTEPHPSATRHDVEWHFSAQTTVVTGGSTGIGRAISEAFVAAGCEVWIASLPGPELEEARRASSLRGAHFVNCDVSDDAQVGHLFSKIDRLNNVVQCAGIIARDEEFEIQKFVRVIDVNLTGAMRVATAARPLLLKSGGGSIVNIASLWALFGGPRVPAYTASKGGIKQLTKSLAVAWAPDNIRVNALAPGWIATNLSKEAQETPEVSARILARTPMGRWGTGEDVAGAALFLCSSAARFITGVTLPVDGGFASC